LLDAVQEWNPNEIFDAATGTIIGLNTKVRELRSEIRALGKELRAREKSDDHA